MRNAILSFTIILAAFGWLVLPAGSVLAQVDAPKQACEGAGGNFVSGNCVFDNNGNATLENRFNNIMNALLFIVGAIAVLMIIIGAIRFATSGGDADAAKGARNTIMYALIAVIVALVAYALVRFVIRAVGT